MSKNEFEFKNADLLKLRQLFKKSPKLFNLAVIGTLNNMAFETRTEVLETINDQMEIRSQKFVNSRVQVKKAKGRDFRNTESVVGSVRSTRFSGWEEQETGKKPESNRTATLYARAGDKSRKTMGKNRLKRSNELAKMSQFQIKAKSKQHRLIIFLQMMSKKKKSFLMPRKYKGLKRGVYTVTKRDRKIHRIQTFGPRRIDKDPWMKRTLDNHVSQGRFNRAWIRSVEFYFPSKLR